MSFSKNRITVFEHDFLAIGQRAGAAVFDQKKWQALARFHQQNDGAFFRLELRGVRFSHFVGVLQIGSLTVEVLPKAEKTANDPEKWRKNLIGMLRASGLIDDVRATESTALRAQPNDLLDLYFELFLAEIEQLLRLGLVKKYRSADQNRTSWKGQMLVSKHLQLNLTDSSRFFTRAAEFGTEHFLNQILLKTLRLIRSIGPSPALAGRLAAAILAFPEWPDLAVSERLFARVRLDRKTEPYRKSLEIARLLLLHFYPDVARGRENVLALMFDMNGLWERFLLASLRRNLDGWRVEKPRNRAFWLPERGAATTMQPDLFLQKDGEKIVLDAKWKLLGDGKNAPSPHDLRQLFVYQTYFEARRGALIFPGKMGETSGFFAKKDEKSIEKDLEKACALLPIAPPPIGSDVRAWQKTIAEKVKKWASG